MSDERTAKDFVRDMLLHGADWMAVLAVARCIRGGRWRKEAAEILQAKGLMSKDEKVIENAYAARRAEELSKQGTKAKGAKKPPKRA